ncbi:MAG: nucleoside diphosphate kinase regulator [Clostridia bacterium]
MTKEIYITEADRERLTKLIDTELRNGKKQEKHLETLESEINKAKVVDPHQIRGDIITMNSRMILSLDGEEMEAVLVYPEEADWLKNKISVFSPIGTAILGYGEGDVIEWNVPSGKKEIIIKKVIYQPETAGDYHL